MSMLKILFITDNFPPEMNAPATRTYEHCREWVRQGAEVTVITCAPNFPRGIVFPGYRNRVFQKEILDGIEVMRVWTYITANQGFLKRTVDYMSFALSAFICGIFRKTDIVIATSPQFFTTWAALGLSVCKRRPWIFELRDLWPESIRTVGAMGQRPILDFLERVELFLYRRAHMIVAVSPAFRQNLVARGVSAGKIEVVPNGTNHATFKATPKDPELMRTLKLEDKFVVGYIGTHGLAHNLEFIVACLKEFEDRGIHFLFIGDGARKAQVVQTARAMGVTNATFLDPVAKDEVPRYMSVTDVSLVPLKKAETFKTVIPSKIFEAAGMQKPILLGVDGQAREIVENYGAGIYFEPENEDDFIGAVKNICEDKDLYQRLQSGCERLSRSYDRSQMAKKMLSLACSLC